MWYYDIVMVLWYYDCGIMIFGKNKDVVGADGARASLPLATLMLKPGLDSNEIHVLVYCT